MATNVVRYVAELFLSDNDHYKGFAKVHSRIFITF